MKKVKSIIESKGNEVYSITSTAAIIDALVIMAEKEVGALLVIDEGQITGIISERDYARKVVLKGKNSSDNIVKDIMTRDVVYVSPDTTLEEVMALMLNKRIRHLPVLENEKLTGLISIGDVVKAVIEDKGYLINELEQYINYRR